MKLNVVRICGHTLLAAPLTENSVVIDFGMNRGEFSRLVSKIFNCRIFGAEAHPGLHAALPSFAKVVAHNVAIAGGPGKIDLNVFDRHCASVVFDKLEAGPGQTISVPTMGIGQFLSDNKIGRVDLLKCDIEGAELDMFEAATDEELSRIDQITIEFHDFLDPGQREPVSRVFERLRRLGFWGMDFSKNRMDVLFVNQRTIPIGPFGRLGLLFTKYQRAIRRIIGRQFGRQDLGNTGLGQMDT
jgi:FkbM family methyltransferase